ncbi:MAG: ABC transporter permease subunit [Candidatus Pacebacteria bacterium]|nr:ABC transporter permease subunit [Candidatus Paceibacterota bacterium]
MSLLYQTPPFDSSNRDSAMGFDLSILGFGAQGWGLQILVGTAVTVAVAICSLLVGMLIGAVLVAMKLSRYRLVRLPAKLYTIFIRGTPEFLVILLVYFGSESIINAILGSIGLGRIDLPKFPAAVAGLSAIYGAYVSEVLRGAYLAVPKGQMEAAAATGLSPFTSLVRIRIPQIWRYALPGLGNLWLSMLKDSSLAAVIALDELLRVSKLAGELTQHPLVFYSLAGLIYLGITALSDIGRRRLEAKAQLAYQTKAAPGKVEIKPKKTPKSDLRATGASHV